MKILILLFACIALPDFTIAMSERSRPAMSPSESSIPLAPSGQISRSPSPSAERSRSRSPPDGNRRPPALSGESSEVPPGTSEIVPGTMILIQISENHRLIGTLQLEDVLKLERPYGYAQVIGLYEHLEAVLTVDGQCDDNTKVDIKNEIRFARNVPCYVVTPNHKVLETSLTRSYLRLEKITPFVFYHKPAPSLKLRGVLRIPKGDIPEWVLREG